MDWGAGAPQILKESAESDPPLRSVLTPFDPGVFFRDAQILRVSDHQDPTIISRRIGHRIAPVRVVRVLLNVSFSSVARVMGQKHWLVATEEIIPWKGPERGPLRFFLS